MLEIRAGRAVAILRCASGAEDTSSQPQDALPHLLPKAPGPRQGGSHCPAPGHAARAHGICIVTISTKFISQKGLGAPGQKGAGSTHYPGSTRAWPSRPPATRLGSPPPHPGQSPHPLPTMAFHTLSDLQKSVCHAGYNEVALSPLALKKKKKQDQNTFHKHHTAVPPRNTRLRHWPHHLCFDQTQEVLSFRSRVCECRKQSTVLKSCEPKTKSFQPH